MISVYRLSVASKSGSNRMWQNICFVTVRHRCFRPAMDETGILGFVFVLLSLHFCFLLGNDFTCCEKTPAGREKRQGTTLVVPYVSQKGAGL
jgi:hypothetical protein